MTIAPPAESPVEVFVHTDTPPSETDEPKDPDAGKSAEDLIREYANYLQTTIEVRSYPRARTEQGDCDACGETEEIQGEIRLYVQGVLMRRAHVGKCEEWVFEKTNLTAEECRKKVQMALAGEIVCDDED